MINLEEYLKSFKEEITKTFENRVAFIGLQGSYARGEASGKSDLDLVVILDEVTYEDLLSYDSVLNNLPHRDKICGFLSGMAELLCWDAGDLFQFYHDTVAIKGDLSWMENKILREDIVRAVHVAGCNIYHMAVHNAIHAKNKEVLKEAYKSAKFALQAKVYLEKGQYVKRTDELMALVEGMDKEVLAIYENDSEASFQVMSETIINWAKEIILKYA